MLAIDSEETAAVQFRHQCLQFQLMYNNQLALERNQVVIDAANYSMWTQMKELLLEQLRMFWSMERKMDRQLNAIADLYIALASFAAKDPTGLVTREEMVDKLKSEPLEDVPVVPEGKSAGYYLNVLKKATTARAFKDQDTDEAALDALNEIRSRLQALKMGEDFRLLQADVPLADDANVVPERLVENKGLFQALLDEVLEKVTSMPSAEFDLRAKIKAINDLKKQRHPTPAAPDTCLEHPEHFNPTKDLWDKDRRRVKTVDERGMVGDFEKVTIAGKTKSMDSLDFEPPERVVRLQTDSEGSVTFVSSNALSSKYKADAPKSRDEGLLIPERQGDDYEAVKAAKRAGWYAPSLVEGAPDIVEETWNVRPGTSRPGTSRPELQHPSWTVTRTRGSSEDFESEPEYVLPAPKLPVHQRLGKKFDKNKRLLLSPKPANPTMGLSVKSRVVTEPPLYEVTNPKSKAKAGKSATSTTIKTSVNARMGARTMSPRQTKITDYQSNYQDHHFGSP